MDIWLVRKAQKGDSEAFVALMERYKTSLYKVAKCYLRNEEDIADVMQDTVLSAWEHLGEMKTLSFFKTWLTRILINHCKDFLKRQRCYPVVEWTEEMDDFFSVDGMTAEEALAGEAGFSELLDMISEGYRTVFLLYYGEGLNSREIAEVLQISENTVRSRLRRGKAQLEESVQRISYGMKEPCPGNSTVAHRKNTKTAFF